MSFVRRGLGILLLLLILVGNAVAARQAVILILGDSLSAGYGFDARHGWVALLQQRLEQHGQGCKAINASISGDTTSGALQRLPATLKRHRPDVLIIELGGNDGLRGLSLKEMENNLRQMIQMASRQESKVLLLGLRMPPNYGIAYADGFRRVYTELASSQNIALVPFFLDRVALNDAWMQADGVHPTQHAQGQLLENVWPHLRPLIRSCIGAEANSKKGKGKSREGKT